MDKVLKQGRVALSDKCISIADTPLRIPPQAHENTVRELEDTIDDTELGEGAEADVFDSELADIENEGASESEYIQSDEEQSEYFEDDMPIVLGSATHSTSEQDAEPKLYRFPTLEEKINNPQPAPEDTARRRSGESGHTDRRVSAKHAAKAESYDELVSQAVSEASRILESAHAKAQDEYVQMMAKGRIELEKEVQSAREAGYAEAMRTQIDKVRDTIKRLETAVADIEGRQEAYLTTCEQDIKWLAIEIASKIMHTSLNENELGIMPLVKAAVATQRGSKWLTVEVSGATGELLEMLHEQLEQSDPDRMKRKAAANAQEGTCLIQMPEGFVDASIYTQIENLKQYFTLADS